MKYKNWNLIIEKYDTINHIKSSLSRFLKRRRLDLNMTLDELSKGICSTSYLSKIENGQVEVDESYYLMLFEKLDLDFEEVKATREQSIYQELLRLYLYEKYDVLAKRVNDLISTKYYCHTEVEIMVMLYNVVNGNLDEAQKMMSSLVEIQAALAPDDIKMLAFVMTLYYIKTAQYQKAFDNIEMLEQFMKSDEKFTITVLDLMLEIYFLMNKKSLFFTTLASFLVIPLVSGMYKRVLRHRLQGVVLISIETFHKGIVELARIKEEMEHEDCFFEEYRYYAALIYFHAQKYEQVYKLLETGDLDERLIVLKALLVISDSNYKHHYEFIRICKHFESDNLAHQCVVEYARQKVEQYSYMKLFAYLRSVVLPLLKQNANIFLKVVFLDEYVRIAVELGKYKDTLRFVVNNNMLLL